MVPIDEWWNVSITATVETVITKYIQYNNTMLPSTDTVTAQVVEVMNDIKIRNPIIQRNLTDHITVIGTETMLNLNSTVM